MQLSMVMYRYRIPTLVMYHIKGETIASNPQASTTGQVMQTRMFLFGLAEAQLTEIFTAHLTK